MDEMFHIDLTKVVNRIGYNDFKCLSYRHPKLSLAHGLRPLNTDRDVLKFAEDVKGFEEIEIYVEHLIDTPIFIEGSTNKKGKETEKVEVVDLDSVEGSFASELEVEDEGVGGVETLVEGESETDDEDYVDNVEEEVESDDTSVDDSDYDENWDWTSVLSPETANSIGSKKLTPSSTVGVGLNDIDTSGCTHVRVVSSSRNPEPTSAVDFDNEDGDSNFLLTPPGSEDDEQERPKFPKFRMTEDGSNVKFEV